MQVPSNNGFRVTSYELEYYSLLESDQILTHTFSSTEQPTEIPIRVSHILQHLGGYLEYRVRVRVHGTFAEGGDFAQTVVSNFSEYFSFRTAEDGRSSSDSKTQKLNSGARFLARSFNLNFSV